MADMISTYKIDLRQDDIQQAFFYLLDRYPFETITMEQIAQRAGISELSLKRRFPKGKEDITQFFCQLLEQGLVHDLFKQLENVAVGNKAEVLANTICASIRGAMYDQDGMRQLLFSPHVPQSWKYAGLWTEAKWKELFLRLVILNGHRGLPNYFMDVFVDGRPAAFRAMLQHSCYFTPSRNKKLRQLQHNHFVFGQAQLFLQRFIEKPCY